MLLLFGSTFGVQVTGSGGASCGGDSATILGTHVVITVVGAGGAGVGGSNATIAMHNIYPVQVAVGGASATIEAINVQSLEVLGASGVVLGGDAAEIESVLIVLQSLEIDPSGGAACGGVSATIVQGGSFPSISGGVAVGGNNAGISWTLTNPNWAPGDAGEETTTHTATSTQHRGWTTVRDILLALHARIVSQMFPTKSHLVYIDVDPPSFEYKPGNDEFILIVPPNESTETDAIAGGGEDIDLRDARVEIRLYHRTALDQRGRETIWTLDNTAGIGPSLKALEQAIQLYELDDQSGTVIVAEPIRILGTPIFNSAPKGWGFVSLTVQVRYRFDLPGV